MSPQSYSDLLLRIKSEDNTWLITGVAGFIGSNLLECLLRLKQKVVGLDNFSTGHRTNLEQVRSTIPSENWAQFKFIEGDITDINTCHAACRDVDFVLHQAALGSVPRSLQDPIATNASNIDGFLNMLVSAKESNVTRFVYAASSSTYGDEPSLPKVENKIGKPLSPYALTKLVNEMYAEVFARCYGFTAIGLRYFNVFGPRQDPNGAYAAVIPKWISSMIKNEEVWINGDGETSRDFCYIDNVVQANLMAACTDNEDAVGEVFNVAVGERTSLNQLFELIKKGLQEEFPYLAEFKPNYRDFRNGDVRHSLADVHKAKSLLGYVPSHTIQDGIEAALPWYINQLS